MPASTVMPEVTVAIAFATAPDDPIPAWMDVTDYHEAQEGASIARGRGDELSQVQPSTLSLTFDNRDGRFTPQRPASPYYPNVKKSKRIRLSARWPLGQPGNFITNSTFEVNATGWAAFGAGVGSIARSTTRAQEGVASGLITWGTAGSGSWIGTQVNLVIGKTYTASAYVWVPTSQPDVRLGTTTADGSSTSTKNAWVRISVTFTPTTTTQTIGIKAAAGTTAGQTCFVDAVQVDEGSSVVTFTSSPPPIYHRFTGNIDEWPLEWKDGTDSAALCKITATSRQTRMGHGAELRSIVEMEYLEDDPAMYYPLGDAEGTTKAGNVSTTVQSQMAVTPFGAGNFGNISFGSATGPGTDGLTAALFTRVSPTGGAYLLASSPTVFVEPLGTPTGSILLECFFLTNATQEMGIAQADQFGYFPGQTAYYLGLNASGKLVGVSWVVGSPLYTITSAATVSDGNTHHAALRETYNGTNTVADLFLDGVKVATTTIAGDWRNAIARLMGGGGLVNSAYAGTLAHVAITWGLTAIPDNRILQHYLSGSTGFAGERSDQRITRLARYAGIASSEVSVETGLSATIAAQDTTNRTPIDLMQEVTATENGLLFDGGDGSLVFQARSHRYNVTPMVTLAADLQEIESGLTPKLDDQGMANDVTASRVGGVTVRAVDTASIAEYGAYRDDLQLVTTSDTEVEAAAYWSVGVRAQPGVRIPTAPVDLLNASTSQKTALLEAELSDRAALSGLPSQAPAASMDFFIEGLTEEIGAESWQINFNLSPASAFGVWQLDSSVYSLLGTTTRLAY